MKIMRAGRVGGWALALVFGGVALAAQRPARDAVVVREPQAMQIFETLGAARTMDAGGRQSRQVRVRFDALEQAGRESQRVSIPLDGVGTVVAAMTSYEAQPEGFFTKGALVGGPAGQPVDGEATFTVFNGLLVGRIVSNGRLFMVRRDPSDEVHRITEVDQASLPSEQQPRPMPAAAARDAGLMSVEAGGDSGAFVDVLVVYTNAARAAMGGSDSSPIQAEVVGAINNANAALEAGGAVHRFRLAHQSEVSYTEIGTTTTASDLDRVTNVNDGYLDDVHRLRDLYDADIVSLVTTQNACGVGWVLQTISTSFQAYGFNANHYSCINDGLTLAHEIGHNMGLHHDRKNAVSNGQLQQGSSSYAYGYRIAGARDVMAYPCNLPTQESFGTCARKTIFSTPQKSFPGTSSAAGVSNSEDNVRALNDSSPTVANFRDSTCSYTVSSNSTSFPLSGGGGTVTVTTGSGCAWAAVSSDTSMATFTSSTLTRVGSGTFTFAVSASSSGRSAQIHAGGQSVTLDQGTVCSATVSLSSSTFTRAGGTGTATVSYPSGCTTAWTASSDQSFVTITSGSSGNGSGTVGFSVAANSGSTSRSAVLTIAGQTASVTQTGSTLTPSPSSLRFGATKNGAGGDLVAVTDPQVVTVVNEGSAASSWTAAPNQTWLQVTNGSGTGSGTFTVAVVNPGNVIAGQTSLTGSITLTGTNVSNSPVTLPVTLTVTHTSTSPVTQRPFGAFDTPAQSAAVSGSIAVTGWALDDVGVARVEIWRDAIPNDPAPPFHENGHLADGKVFIATGTFVSGSRLDVEALYTTSPARHRAGWGYMLLTWGLPASNGTFTLHAIAFDEEGQSASLGSKTITVNNATATKPFGAIDVPSYGGTFTGHQFTFGWALTPASGCTMSGGQRYMTIDSAPPNFPVTYGANRTDIAAAFPGFADSNGAGGAVALNSLNYTNGTHQIGWLVYDSCGNGEGIGSRFFTILNSGADAPRYRDVIEGSGPSFARVDQAPPGGAVSADPLWLVRGMGTRPSIVSAGAAVWLTQTGRVEVHVTEPAPAGSEDPASIRRSDPATRSDPASDNTGDVRYEGYLAHGGVLRPLPIGSSFDAARGSFYWQPVAGFLGTYDLRILRLRGNSVDATWTVPLVVGPDADQHLLQIDRAEAGGPGLSERALRVEGWTLDPQAADGSGIGLVHVWATRKGSEVLGSSGPGVQGGAAPIFLGSAGLGGYRPDVGGSYGRQFDFSGYSLMTAALEPGEYEVVVYAWSLRTAQWEIARPVAVTVK